MLVTSVVSSVSVVGRAYEQEKVLEDPVPRREEVCQLVCTLIFIRVIEAAMV